jgi:hypothetical protein
MAKKVGIAAVLACALAFGSLFYYAPYSAVKNMRAAAEAGDSVALARYINFPSVREGLKASLSAKMGSLVAKERSGNAFAALGATIAVALVNQFIDAMVTPESLAMMMRGESPTLEGGEPKAKKTSTAAMAAADTVTTMGYETFDEFVISAKNPSSTDSVALVFRRDGLLSWKLSAIRLPL